MNDFNVLMLYAYNKGTLLSKWLETHSYQLRNGDKVSDYLILGNDVKNEIETCMTLKAGDVNWQLNDGNANDYSYWKEINK